MALEIVKDPKLIQKIESERNSSKAKPFIDLVVALFNDAHLLQLGGSVRDAIVSGLYGNQMPTRDWDFLVDETDVDIFELCKHLPGDVGRTALGNVRWRPNGYEVDVMGYSKLGRKIEPQTPEGFLMTCDFNIGALAYSLRNRAIISNGALEGIRSKTISVMNPEAQRPQATIIKAINFERRLGFKLDERTIKYIRETYSPAMDPAIAEYIAYKKMPQEAQEYIMQRLAELAPVRR